MGTHPIFESDYDCLTDLSRRIHRHGPLKASWSIGGGRDQTHGDDHAQPPPIQNPRLVLEQAEGLQGRHLLASHLQRPRIETPRRFGENEEDPMPPWSPTSLAPPCPWSAYQDHWPTRSHRWCLQEEVKPHLPEPKKLQSLVYFFCPIKSQIT